MALSPDTRQQFLAAPHVAALGVAEPGRAPLVVPIWYGYQPGGQPWILTEENSRKGKAIKAAGRFSLMVDTVTPRTMYVSVEGSVASIEAAGQQENADLAARYLTGAELDGYLAASQAMTGLVVIRLRPEHWVSADLTVQV
ncbi:pyridoxamine 5-phosphate oxidase [Flexivirga sp. ID2601S]|uniref:Pyridoxamine 5-phosphate oxidase n=1 Tax=Flexivirga aerilata TaxID=1656889 RepID=A0A849AJH0_9MICO|nr:pyridoxamine 5'-phosphate oxidase family protein [Flexivirga aerilata]NNG39676.1 pyridoxamine 5-phosphate oxidase [Flexivirga aerilata]